MKLKTTIILLIIAILGITYVLVYERKQVPQEEWQRLQKKVLPYFKSSLVKKIKLDNEDGTLVLEKADNDYWYIVKPQKLRADNSEVRSILSEFEFMSKIGSFKKEGETPFDLKEYGLDDPKTSITMYTTVKKDPDKIRVSGPRDKYTVFVGNKLTAGDNVYIKQQKSDEVVVVPGTLVDKVNKGVLDLRSKWVFAFDKEAVNRLKIKSKDHIIVCEKDGQFWRMKEPIEDIADYQNVRDIIDKLKKLRISREDFLPEGEEDNLPKYGLDDPRFTVTISEHGNNQSAQFGYSLDNKVYVKRVDEPTIFLLQDDILIDLKKKPNDLRDRRLVRFESFGSYGVNKLKFKTRSTAILIEKSLDLDYYIKEPIEIYADQDITKNFIEKIKTLKIEDFVDDNPQDLSVYGLKDPMFVVSVTKEENKELARFLVGNKLPDKNKCYVKRVDEDPVYTVSTVGFYDKLENALLEFRDKLVCDFNRDSAKKLVIEKPDRTFICEKTNKLDENGNVVWELEEPIQTKADSERVKQIVWDLSFLKADDHVVENPKDLSVYGLENPRIKVHVTYEKNLKQSNKETADKQSEQMNAADNQKPPEKIIETRTLLIGDTVAGGTKENSYCMFSDDDLVFELSWPKIRDFNAELVPTKIFSFDRKNVNKLTLAYPDKNILIEKENNVWNIKNYDKKDFLSREVDYFVGNLETLRGEYIEQYKTTNLTQFSLNDPQLTITAETDNDSVYTLHIGKKKDDDSYYVKNEDSDFVYVVDKDSIERLMKKEDDFSVDTLKKDLEAAAKALKEEKGKEMPPSHGNTNIHGSQQYQGRGSHGGGFH